MPRSLSASSRRSLARCCSAVWRSASSFTFLVRRSLARSASAMEARESSSCRSSFSAVGSDASSSPWISSSSSTYSRPAASASARTAAEASSRLLRSLVRCSAAMLERRLLRRFVTSVTSRWRSRYLRVALFSCSSIPFASASTTRMNPAAVPSAALLPPAPAATPAPGLVSPSVATDAPAGVAAPSRWRARTPSSSAARYALSSGWSRRALTRLIWSVTEPASNLPPCVRFVSCKSSSSPASSVSSSTGTLCKRLATSTSMRCMRVTFLTARRSRWRSVGVAEPGRRGDSGMVSACSFVEPAAARPWLRRSAMAAPDSDAEARRRGDPNGVADARSGES
mmetsp:Transcript_11643/g.45282  ORF Transcript_11643/g.45282 Transcript_11643/m.45282 type:complete len:340 (-) Transcript_11643:138-1157(-)